jgi:hypothetical protein
LPLQRGPIGLRSTAAEILYVEASHVPNTKPPDAVPEAPVLAA